MSANRRTLTYTAWSVTPVAAVAAGLALSLGKAGLLFAGFMALPWLAWRYDNETGAFFPLALFVLFLLGVLGLLLFLMAIVLH